MQLTLSRSNVCPCCGYAGLEQAQYDQLKSTPVSNDLQPPYCQYFGFPSYEVCACCGFEFGFDDEPGVSEPSTFHKYRQEWIADGAKWFDASKLPVGWSLHQQLQAAGIEPT